MQYRGYKYRLYPDAEARAFFARCFGATRYCYNFCVREYNASCEAGRELSGYDVGARLREHTKNLAWMADVDYEIKESAPRRFDNALGKYKRREANRPREHKKGERPEISYTTGGVIKVDFKHGLVQLPKIGIVRARLHRPFSGQIVSATIKHEADGNYYISLTVYNEEVAIPRKPHTEAGTVGVDVGLRHLATLSIDGDGKYIDLPDMSRGEARIQFLKKRLSLAKEGSRRAKRTKLQIARLQHHLANVTRDAHHKAAARLCRDFDTICMETLNVAGMKQDTSTTAGIAFNQRLQRSALSLFIGRVERKAADTGTNFVKIDRFEPSTKRCHVCGYVLDDIDLHTKEWTCPECHTHHDRDHNAAINIRNKGLELLPIARQAATTHKLPLAEGNVKPAKKATAGCDLRTGKMTGRPGRHIKSQLARQPKAQIAQGSAPPRTFYIQHLDKNHPFRYFKMSTLGRMVGLNSHKSITTFIDECRFMNPTPEERETAIKLLKAIKTVAASLRQMRLTDGDPAYTKYMLGKMNKVARVDWALREHFHFNCTFTLWRNKRLSKYEINEINQIATVDFPNKLDAMADKYLRPLLPPEPEEEPKPLPAKAKKPLRRERKDDPVLTPSDDPNLLTYEGQILTILPGYFIWKQCHIIQDTYNKIIGKGSLYRPDNCTRSRMATFVSALYDAADILAGIDTTVEGQRERMDQLYYINQQYVRLDEVVVRYFFNEKELVFNKFFTRAGKTVPALYNKHYNEIMKVITHDIPKLIRESAAYLAGVYQIEE